MGFGRNLSIGATPRSGQNCLIEKAWDSGPMATRQRGIGDGIPETHLGGMPEIVPPGSRGTAGSRLSQWAAVRIPVFRWVPVTRAGRSGGFGVFSALGQGMVVPFAESLGSGGVVLVSFRTEQEVLPGKGVGRKYSSVGGFFVLGPSGKKWAPWVPCTGSREGVGRKGSCSRMM
ncbi:unnamed protein product [Calypogeia fissa]